jgi:glucokinase
MPSNLYLGIDIGGTSIKFGVVDLSTRAIIAQSSIVTPVSKPEDSVELIAREIAKIKTQNPINATIGVGAPGAMNLDRTVVRNPPNLPEWHEVPLKKMIEERSPGMTVELDNDAKVATLAEAKFGAAEGLDNFIMLTLGTGVGGGIFADGKIFRGASGGAGEFGQFGVDAEGTPLEKYIGQRYLASRALDKLRTTDSPSSLRQFLQGNSLDPKEIYDAAEAGDSFAIKVFKEAGELLGMCCADVAKLLDISIYVIGGGVARAGDLILMPALEVFKAHVLPHQVAKVELRPAKLGNDAGMLGAALLAADQSAAG